MHGWSRVDEYRKYRKDLDGQLSLQESLRVSFIISQSSCVRIRIERGGLVHGQDGSRTEIGLETEDKVMADVILNAGARKPYYGLLWGIFVALTCRNRR